VSPAQASLPRSWPTPELRIPNAAAQTRIVSKARIRLDSRKSERSFKEIICVDISEFESSHPSHAVGLFERCDVEFGTRKAGVVVGRIFKANAAPVGTRMDLDISRSGASDETDWLAADLNRSRAELKPGTLLTREWDGHRQRVTVLPDGFSWNGKTYPSLSKIAFAMTGTRWNGPRFFGLRDHPASEVRS
jgi:hypothetical protein